MPTVLLAGAFGRLDPGEDALLPAFRAALPEWEIVAASADPHATSAEWNLPAVRDTDRLATARALVDADALVLCGTVFRLTEPSRGRAPHDHLLRMVGLAFAARARQIPVALLGVGAERLPSARARQLARSLARHADLLVMRDEESARLLTEAGAPAPLWVGADPAWTQLDVPPAAPPPRPGRRVIVALGPVGRSGPVAEPPLSERLTAALLPLVAEGLSVTLQPWQTRRAARGTGPSRTGPLRAGRGAQPLGMQPLEAAPLGAGRSATSQRTGPPHAAPLGRSRGDGPVGAQLAAGHDTAPGRAGEPPDDGDVASVVAARIGAEVLPPPGDLRAARSAFRGARLVIALRAPAIAAAAAAAVPVLAVTATPAVAGLARRLGQPAIPVAAMSRPWQFLRAVLAALDAPPAPLSLLKGQVLAADESLRLLRLLLTGGDDHPLPHRGLTLEPAPWLC